MKIICSAHYFTEFYVQKNLLTIIVSQCRKQWKCTLFFEPGNLLYNCRCVGICFLKLCNGMNIWCEYSYHLGMFVCTMCMTCV